MPASPRRHPEFGAAEIVLRLPPLHICATMSITLNPEWQTLLLYAGGAALALILLSKLPYVGRAISFLFSFAMLALVLFVLMQRAPFEPHLSGLAAQLGINDQRVMGDEVRIRMAPDGHFWANVTINGVPRRMLIDSGATVTALSEETATQADVGGGSDLVPVMLQTANGMTRARTGSIERLRVGSIDAHNLKVVISPALGGMNVLGMNFLSDLASWRVEGRTLILVPKAG